MKELLGILFGFVIIIAVVFGLVAGTSALVTNKHRVYCNRFHNITGQPVRFEGHLWAPDVCVTKTKVGWQSVS